MVMPLYDDNPFKLPQKPRGDLEPDRHHHRRVHSRVQRQRRSAALIANQFGVIPAAVSGAVQFPGALSPSADARHLPVPACRHRASDRQHDLPLGVRRQCRAGARPLALPRVLSLVGAAGGARLRTQRSGIEGAADRRVRLDRRRGHRLSDAAALRQDHRAGARQFRCGSAPIGSSACSSSSSSSISARRRRARSPGGAISAACWPAACCSR